MQIEVDKMLNMKITPGKFFEMSLPEGCTFFSSSKSFKRTLDKNANLKIELSDVTMWTQNTPKDAFYIGRHCLKPTKVEIKKTLTKVYCKTTKKGNV